MGFMGVIFGLRRVYMGFRDTSPIMENELERKLENEKETVVIYGNRSLGVAGNKRIWVTPSPKNWDPTTINDYSRVRLGGWGCKNLLLFQVTLSTCCLHAPLHPSILATA